MDADFNHAIGLASFTIRRSNAGEAVSCSNIIALAGSVTDTVPV
jgi:hypothetical protein